MKISPRVGDIHERFCGAMQHRYFIRAHMSAMLAIVLLSGALAGRLLLRAGVTNMAFRYPVMVLLSYAVFFGLIRIWLAYVCRSPSARRSTSSGSDSSGGGILDGSGWSGGGGGGGSSASFSGGGGSSGGAGSSGGFGEVDAAAPRQAASLPFRAPGSGSGSGAGSHSSGKSGGGGDGGDDGILLLVLFVLLVVAVFGAGAWVVYQSPVILSDAAFHAMLAGGLVRTARDAHDPGWIGGVLKATAVPFGVVLILAGVFGYEAHRLCPAAATARQVLRTCVF
jgi:hypothetical protein